MLNLRFAFDDAITAVSEFAHDLKVSSLPATVFLMQADVINSYRYALTHYLTLPLSAHYLQDSSLGSPYQKWSYFTNEDFGMLSFAIRNLLRYSSRLFHETVAPALKAQGRFREFKVRSNACTAPIAEMRTKGIEVGVVVMPDELLEIHSIRGESAGEKVECRCSQGGATVYIRIDESSQPPREVRIEQAEYLDIMATIRTETVSISDRATLLMIQKRGAAELDVLDQLHLRFAEVCRARFGRLDPFTQFERLNQSCWI